MLDFGHNWCMFVLYLSDLRLTPVSPVTHHANFGEMLVFGKCLGTKLKLQSDGTKVYSDVDLFSKRKQFRQEFCMCIQWHV